MRACGSISRIIRTKIQKQDISERHYMWLGAVAPASCRCIYHKTYPLVFYFRLDACKPRCIEVTGCWMNLDSLQCVVNEIIRQHAILLWKIKRRLISWFVCVDAYQCLMELRALLMKINFKQIVSSLHAISTSVTDDINNDVVNHDHL